MMRVRPPSPQGSRRCSFMALVLIMLPPAADCVSSCVRFPAMQASRAAVSCGAPADFFEAHLGCSAQQASKAEGKMLSNIRAALQYPQMQVICSALQSRLALSDAQLQKVVVALPSVLGLSFESNLAPKLEFLQTEIGLSLDDMRERVVRLPAILSYSQEKRFRPRLAACRKVGAVPTVVLDRITQPDSKFFLSIGMAEWDA